ncbi:hypothetical protein LC085_11205 [Bacillus tianshenii]|uniref:hypothetical protein n=1 Tax=Sutcliffiella tianshenii TaxID=1463404 RepID=UPI001CD3D160|nr:hypothetical protein [Bacillus tianshenii]MCA1320478.1 hypothetical protein [Bacillus tianshenii]
MSKFKFFHALLIFSLIVSFILPSAAGAESNGADAATTESTPAGQEALTVIKDTYSPTGDTYDPTGDTYCDYADPTCDTYEQPVEAIQVEYTSATESSITVEFVYNGELTEDLAFEFYLNGELYDTVYETYDYNFYTFFGLESDTEYAIEIMALKGGEYTDEYAWAYEYTHSEPYGDVVQFEDSRLEEAVKTTLDVYHRAIQESDMQRLYSLEAYGYGIESLEGLQSAYNLEYLDLSGNMITDISPIADLEYISHLDLSYNGDIMNLESLLSMQYLTSFYYYDVYYGPGSTNKQTIQALIDKEVEVGVNPRGWYFEEYYGKWLYFTHDRGAYVSGWLKDNNKWYYLSEDPYEGMSTGWDYIGGKWYFFNQVGAMLEGPAWVKLGGKWYYAEKSGAMKTGWYKEGSTWYFFDKVSTAMKTGWHKDGNTWYHFKSTGAMSTGWYQEGSTWYYLNTSGAMATGWKEVGGKWYYFYTSGKMAANTTIDGYKLGASGAWIK